MSGAGLGDAWQRFWFEPEETSSLALLRIVFGTLAFFWTLSLAPDLGAFFGGGGLLTRQPGGAGVWGVLGLFGGNGAIGAVFIVLLLSCLALALGFHTRVASVLVFVGILSFQRRNPYVFNGGDALIRIMAFYLMLAPAGAALSLDRLRTHPDDFWAFPARARWPVRLMQIQLSVVYIGGLWLKLQGSTWNAGTAVSYALRISDLSRFPLPSVLSHSPLLSNLLTFGTVALELSLGLLVWNRRLRLPVLLAGVSLHVGIGYSIRVGFFSAAMLTLYLSFLDPAWTGEHLLWLRERYARRRARAGEESLTGVSRAGAG
jgi:hypothetical protein